MAKKPVRKNITIQSLINRYAASMMSPAQMRATARKETNIATRDSLRDLRTTYQMERERTLREQYAQGTYAGMLRGFGAPGSAEAQSVRDAYARAAGLNQAEARGLHRPTTRSRCERGHEPGVGRRARGATAGRRSGARTRPSTTRCSPTNSLRRGRSPLRPKLGRGSPRRGGGCQPVRAARGAAGADFRECRTVPMGRKDIDVGRADDSRRRSAPCASRAAATSPLSSTPCTCRTR